MKQLDMNILIDINHPCHVHIFKNFYKEIVSNGHKVVVTCKNIPSAEYLLRYYEIPYILIDYRSDSIIGKFVAGIAQNLKMRSIVKENKIDIGLGTSMNIAHLSKITKMKSIILDDDDDEVEPLFVKFVHPFADTILSPESVRMQRKTSKAVFYHGFHELAYLHPNLFSPNVSVLKKLNVNSNEKYFILRFNAFKAHHDLNERGLSIAQKRILISKLLPFGKVYITTERELESEFQQYQIKIAPEDMHSALYFSSLFISDSQTMTSEAAILGTPSLRCNSFVGRIAYLEEEEKKYGLTFGYLPENFDQLLSKIDEILLIPDLKEAWEIRRQKLLSEKLNTKDFLVWFVETYPESASIMKSNPDFQNNFIN